MQRNLWEKFIKWACYTFGHKPNMETIWKHEGKVYTECKRCRRIITAYYDKSHGRLYWR